MHGSLAISVKKLFIIVQKKTTSCCKFDWICNLIANKSVSKRLFVACFAIIRTSQT